MRALRNIICALCNSAYPEPRAVRAYAGRAGSVPIWVCRACAADPEAGVEKRKAQQAKAAARRHNADSRP